MSMCGREIRMGKLFSKGQNAVIVAVDHGYMDGPVPAMINLPETVRQIDSGVDGILLSPGMLKSCQHAFNYKGAPIPIVRLNWSTVFCFEWKYQKSYTVKSFSPQDALALGAEIALISMTMHSGDERTDADNIELFGQIASECRHCGMPVI
jgi:class I fructose-bisphosphate aldolase